MNEFKRGLKGGLPIGIGYFAVSFTIGILMRNACFTPFQGFLFSIINNTSAGEVAGISIIQAGGSYLEIAISQLVINARYLLMSAALIPAIDPTLGSIPRFLIANDIADETFALNIMQKRPLDPHFAYGVAISTMPLWAMGAALGIIFGNILPERVVSALSVALYAMFVAVIIPPAKKNRFLFPVIIISMASSYLFSIIPYLSSISEGFRVIILTLVISAIVAVIKPVKEKSNEE